MTNSGDALALVQKEGKTKKEEGDVRLHRQRSNLVWPPRFFAVVHNHSPAVIPFADTAVPLRPMNHIPGFLGRRGGQNH